MIRNKQDVAEPDQEDRPFLGPEAETAFLFADKNRPPSLTGAKLPWFSRVARAFLAADGGVAAGADRSLRGGGYAAFTAAPHRSRTPYHGGMWCPGPPNCFPST